MSNELNLQMEIDEVDFPNLFNFLSRESNQILRTREFCVLAENALLGLVQNANGETHIVETPRAESPIAIETPKPVMVQDEHLKGGQKPLPYKVPDNWSDQTFSFS